MGHELTHAFDDEGSQFDAQGNLRNWWTEADAAEFEKRAKCVVDQYSGYTVVDDIKINGKLTYGEDIADLGGPLLAYLAWKEDTKNQKLEPIEGFTPEQRFFIGYGQSWCTNETRGEPAPAGDGRSALAGEISGEWRGREHAGISRCVPLCSRSTHGSAATVQSVVRNFTL